MRKRQHLSSDTLITLQGVVDTIDAQLDKLHWAILPFLPRDTHKGANAIETLRNIEKQRNEIKKAKTELGQVFETQFSLKHHAKCCGMTLYAYKKRLKEHEQQNPLGNSRPYFFKRKTSKEKAPSTMG